jgi:hypothetical protein
MLDAFTVAGIVVVHLAGAVGLAAALWPLISEEW